MELCSTKEPQFLIITVQEARIDAAVALTFKDQFREHSEGNTPVVVLNLTQVEFIDSSGLGAIVAAMKMMAPDRQLILAGLTPTVERVFKLTRMDTVFSIYARLEDAMRAMKGAGA